MKRFQTILGLLTLCSPLSAQVRDLDELPLPEGLAPAEPLVAVDGAPVKSGRIPATTSAKARGLWQAVLRSTGVTADGRLHGFDLRFGIEVNRDGVSHNDLGNARFQFWSEKEWLRSDWEKNGRTQMVGPHPEDPRRRDYWLIEGKNQTRLEGRENTQSRREMDEWTSIARNFVALATPGASRLVELRELGGPEVELPTQKLRARASKLEWLLVRSPDFHLVAGGSAGGADVFRARLGIEPSSGEIALTVLSEDRDVHASAPTAVLVETTSWLTLGKHRLPKQLKVYRPRADEDAITRGFEPMPSADLYLLERDSRLNPVFAPADFMP